LRLWRHLVHSQDVTCYDAEKGTTIETLCVEVFTLKTDVDIHTGRQTHRQMDTQTDGRTHLKSHIQIDTQIY
jgi:hypothetical protein